MSPPHWWVCFGHLSQSHVTTRLVRNTGDRWFRACRLLHVTDVMITWIGSCDAEDLFTVSWWKKLERRRLTNRVATRNIEDLGDGPVRLKRFLA